MEQGYHLAKLIQDAQVRWLKPLEVLFILQHHECIGFTHKAPHKPPSGSLYIFNKRVNRYFRNDGHSWQRKKNGRTLAEGHERLKVNEPFSFDKTFPIYPDWFDQFYGYKVTLYLICSIGPDSIWEPPMHSITRTGDKQSNKVGNREALTCYYTQGDENPCLRRRIFWMLDPAYDHIVLVHYREYSQGKSSPNQVLSSSKLSYSTPPPNNISDTNLSTQGLYPSELTGLGQNSRSPGSTEEVSSKCITTNGDNTENFNTENFNISDWVENYDRLDGLELSPGEANGNFVGCSEVKVKDNSHHILDVILDEFSEGTFEGKNSDHMNGHVEVGRENTIEMLKKSEWWMEELQFEETLKESSTLLMVQKPLCNIREISPEWAFSNEVTKIIIVGEFPCNLAESQLWAWFGDKQVPAEIIQEGVLRCWSPPMEAGKVSFHVTDQAGEPCSQMQEFEFREKPSLTSTSDPEELGLLIELVKTLLGESSEYLEILNLQSLMEKLLKDTLQNLVLKERVMNEKGAHVLPKNYHGIIHLISGLGFDWGLNLLLDSGVNVNYRDKNGWTALHWAARFGREQMVTSLILAGASAEALSDPTSCCEGRSAASIAETYGHGGIAAYLSETRLVNHPLASENSNIAIYHKEVHVNGGTEDQLSLKDSLEGARNVIQAARRIQQAFRNLSFRTKKENEKRYDRANSSYGISLEEMCEIGSMVKSNKQGYGYRSDPVSEKAALSIQKNFRCWKNRKEFLHLKRNVVKIQAHYRAHKVRQNKGMLWTAKLLEKALRWKKGSAGSSRYQREPEIINHEMNESDILKDFRKQVVEKGIDEAVSTVVAMIDCPVARQQYRRMLIMYQQAKEHQASHNM